MMMQGKAAHFGADSMLINCAGLLLVSLSIFMGLLVFNRFKSTAVLVTPQRSPALRASLEDIQDLDSEMHIVTDLDDDYPGHTD